MAAERRTREPARIRVTGRGFYDGQHWSAKHPHVACNTRRAARLVAARGVPVYLYEWAHTMDGPPFAHALGPSHGVDEFFLFDITAEGVGPSQAERPVVEVTQDRWGAFARGAEPWPRYEPASEKYFVVDATPSVGDHLKSDICDFWDSLQ